MILSMNIYKIDNKLYKIKNNRLYVLNEESNEWDVIYPINSDESYKFNLSYVNFNTGTFINKNHEEISVFSYPKDEVKVLSNIGWMRWFVSQTNCSLDMASDVLNKFPFTFTK